MIPKCVENPFYDKMVSRFDEISRIQIAQMIKSTIYQDLQWFGSPKRLQL